MLIRPDADLSGPSLDPESWDRFSELAHEVLDALIDLQRRASEGPVWRPMPPEVRSRFCEPAPRLPEHPEDIWADVQELVVPYRTGNIHPRFWGWVSGTGTPLGMLAELIAGGLNQVSGIFDDSASAVHAQVIDWMKELMGFPSDATGVMVGGGSVANWVGLAAAREARGARTGDDAGVDPGRMARRGLRESEKRLVLYASSEVHQSVDKAVQLLGLGRDALRRIPVDQDFRLPLDALAGAVERDREAGYEPFAVVANAGTVNTGAVDDLDAIADFCEAEDLWLHVDGAFGALAALAPALRDRVRGMERADSLACDFHKWLFVQYEASFVLVRDGDAHRIAFSVPADYLVSLPRGVGATRAPSSNVGPQLSRGFKALKVWMSLREHGVERYGEVIARNVAQAGYLADLVEGVPELELSAPVELNVVCFRYVGGVTSAEEQDWINREIVMRLHEEGLAVPSYTVVGGRFVIRVANTNHRSSARDFDLLVEHVSRLGSELSDRQARRSREAESPKPSERSSREEVA